MSVSAPSPECLQQFLRFQLPGHTQAMLPTQHLTEILNLTLSQIIPIPDVNPAMMGVCNWRGEVLWLLDLGAWLGLEPLYQQNLRQAKLSVILISHQGQTLGLGVDQVAQMLWCDEGQIQPLTNPKATPELTHCLQGYWSVLGEDPVLVLNGESILNAQI